MPKVDVNAKRGYKASVPIEKYWDKFGNDLEKHLHVPLGENKDKEAKSIDLKRSFHILAAGGALSGVGMFRRVALATLLKFNKPEDLQFILLDPLKISFFYFKNIKKHIMNYEIIKENDKALSALRWVNGEMEMRYNIFNENNARNIDHYNGKKISKKMPRIIVFITELGELMDFNKKETERLIISVAQMTKAVGIHFIITTQRPSLKVLTSLIKRNMPSRIAFQLPDKELSKIILDTDGAENLLGQGDMLVSDCDYEKPERMQGYCLEEEDIEKLVFE